MNSPRLHVVLFSGVILLVVLSGVGGSGSALSADRHSDPGPPELIHPVPNGSALWPYTSKARSFDERTLGINLILRGDERAIRRHLHRHTESEWTTRPHPAEPANGTEEILPIADTGITWRVAHGSTRYTYVEPSEGSGDGTWLVESYQLYDGSYLGRRYHIRAYESPASSERWTAIQAHAEYWDWFRLRHTVTSIAEAQRHVEADLVDDPSIVSLRRTHLDNGDTSDGDGWATVVEFATVILAVGLLWPFGDPGNAVRERIRTVFESRRRGPLVHQGSLFGGIILVTVGVRIAGVALERALPGISPKIVAGVLYPVLVVGLPLCAGYFARRLRMETAFLLAIVAFATALLLDAAYLGLSVIPIRIVVHRIALALSLGLIAAGTSYHSHGGPRWNELVRIGATGWIIGLSVPLIGIV